MVKINFDSRANRRPRGPYTTAKMSPGVKEAIGRLSREFMQRGHTFAETLAFVHVAGYAVKERSLHRWHAKIAKKEPVVLRSDDRGRPAALNARQERFLIGFVVNKNHDAEQATYADCQKALKVKFDIDVTLATVRNYCKLLGISSRLAKRRTAAIKLTTSDAATRIFEWNAKARVDQVFSTTVLSLDFTYNSQRTTKIHSLSTRGGASPNVATKKPKHTDCFLTALWSNGEQSQAVCFTSRKECDPAATASAAKAHFKDVCRANKIASNRFIYVSSEKKDDTKFVAESPALVRSFFHHHGVKSWTVLTDNGNAFKEKNLSVIEDLGMKHVTYDASVHHLQSPNDRSFHGSVKAKVRAEHATLDDDLLYSIRMLYHMDHTPASEIKGYFDKNFMLRCGKVTMERAHDLARSAASDRLEFHDACWREYCHSEGLHVCDDDDVPDDLKTDLDGRYYELKK